MVRFINQNFTMNFNFQSEFKGTGSDTGSDLIDQDLAQKAVQAVHNQGEIIQDSYQSESGNDSSTNSESESTESDICEEEQSGRLIIDEGDKSIIRLEKEQRRKERRRERNKLSAQAYRQRRKTQTLSQEQILHDLEKHHKELLLKVSRLEEEKRFVEEFLKKHVKIPWPWPTYTCPCPCPTTKGYHPTTGHATTTTMPTVTMDAQMSMATTVEVTS